MTDNIGVCATKKTIMKQEKKEFEAEWRGVLKLAVWIGLLTGEL